MQTLGKKIFVWGKK